MNGTIRYTVRPYDTFWMLAQVFNTTAESIMELNPGVDPRNLQIGHVITIRPGYQYYPPYPIDNGMMNNGTMSNGMMNNGMMDNGMMDNGMMNNGMMNNGMMNNGMMNNGMMDNGMMDNGMMNNGMMNNNMMNGMRNGINNDMMGDDYGILSDLKDYFRMLWEQHIMWTRMVFLGILYDLPELEFSTNRLLRNATDFANALRTFYGDETAQAFEDLFREHIGIAGELVNAASANETNQMEAIWQRWVDNANQIAELLASINPNWSAEDWSAMMMEHIEMLANNVADLLEQNYQAAIDDFDEVEAQAMEMADMMAEGIALQFQE